MGFCRIRIGFRSKLSAPWTIWRNSLKTQNDKRNSSPTAPHRPNPSLRNSRRSAVPPRFIALPLPLPYEPPTHLVVTQCETRFVFIIWFIFYRIKLGLQLLYINIHTHTHLLNNNTCECSVCVIMITIKYDICIYHVLHSKQRVSLFSATFCV